MNWAITKKAINSDLSTPLNVLIDDIPLTPIKTIQRGVSAFGASTDETTVTINSVNTSKAKLTLLGVMVGSGSSGTSTWTSNFGVTIRLTNSTTITMERVRNSDSAQRVSWEVIEYV
jgi:hypothetical protein